MENMWRPGEVRGELGYASCRIKNPCSEPEHINGSAAGDQARRLFKSVSPRVLKRRRAVADGCRYAPLVLDGW
jgi:hypothetical protein